MKDYSDEFKADAVALYGSTRGATHKSIAADLGINRATLHEWVPRDRERRAQDAAPVSRPLPESNREEPWKYGLSSWIMTLGGGAASVRLNLHARSREGTYRIMDFTQRMVARFTLHRLLTDMPGEQFEALVQQVLGLRHPDFVPVRTHGALGDMGADGLLLHDRTLYACYSPQTDDINKIKRKFRSDLAKAQDKRAGAFDIFCFVINDLKGVHPELSVLLSEAQEQLRPCRVHHYGWHRLWNDVMRLDQPAVEELLGCELPVQDRTFGIGLADLEPLLARLSEQRRTAEPLTALPEVNRYKLEYNELSEDVQQELRKGLRHSYLVEQYYDGLAAPAEHDLVARGFRTYYEQVRARTTGHSSSLPLARARTTDDELLWSELQQYILGNGAATLGEMWAAGTVIAHFFERCDLFETPPPGWVPEPVVREDA